MKGVVIGFLVAVALTTLYEILWGDVHWGSFMLGAIAMVIVDLVMDEA